MVDLTRGTRPPLDQWQAYMALSRVTARHQRRDLYNAAEAAGWNTRPYLAYLESTARYHRKMAELVGRIASRLPAADPLTYMMACHMQAAEIRYAIKWEERVEDMATEIGLWEIREQQEQERAVAA